MGKTAGISLHYEIDQEGTMVEFQGKVAVIAGAAGNLGAAVARQFISSGARTALLDRSAGLLAEQFPEYQNSVKHLFVECADITQPDIVQPSVQKITDHYGQIDIFVTVVGAYRAGTPLHETPLSSLDFLMAINAQSFYVASQFVIPVMLQQGFGKIVAVGARPGLKGVKNMAAYSASKGALIRLVEGLSEEVKDQGINVNCVLPGTMDTPQNRASAPEADHTSLVELDSIAGVIKFLTSDSARDIHGAAIPVYGLT